MKNVLDARLLEAFDGDQVRLIQEVKLEGAESKMLGVCLAFNPARFTI